MTDGYVRGQLSDPATHVVGSAQSRSETHSSEAAEETRDVAGEQLRLFGGREVPATLHPRPSPHVIQPLCPLAWRVSYECELARKARDRGRHADEGLGPIAWPCERLSK